MILSSPEMRALEQRAFSRGISAEALMEDAAERCAHAIFELRPTPGTCLVVFGKGNNGGDALVIARHLSYAGWTIHLIPAYPQEEWSELPRRKWEEAGLGVHYAPGVEGWDSAIRALPIRPGPLLILDGLLGVGARGSLREPLSGLVRRMNRFRRDTHAYLYAVDLPTGLDPDSGIPGEPCLVADVTLAIGGAKAGLVADLATNHVGRLAVIGLRELPLEDNPASRLDGGSLEEHPLELVATSSALSPLLPPRPYEMHKGQCGRIAIVAGSCGFTGAARMCAEAAARAGAGLITLYVPENAYAMVASSTAPEIMVKGVSSYLQILETNHDVLAIGPGLGKEKSEEVLQLIRKTRVPTVIDADGLNIVAPHLDALSASPAPKLLTPHPGEMERLAPGFGKKTRREVVREFVAAHPVTLLLKGSRTVIGERGRPLSYNSTGTPGMATGGMGDLLTGVCAGLAGQGLGLYDAARLGAWLCGRAGELALSHGGETEETLTPPALLAQFGRAFSALHRQGF